MGNVHGDTFLSIYNRMLDWIRESNTDSNVANLSLDYLNQAQDELRFEALWTELLVIYPLTVTSKVASLPADVGEVCSVYQPDSNGKPIMFFYNKSSYTYDGYREVNAGDKDSGFTRSLEFYSDPTGDVYLDYYKVLADFENSGTEYSWFPGPLLMRKAMLIYLEQEGLSTSAEYAKIEAGFDRALANFKRGHQNVNLDLRRELRDNLGYVINFGSYNLEDGEHDQVQYSPYGNDADVSGVYAL